MRRRTNPSPPLLRRKSLENGPSRHIGAGRGNTAAGWDDVARMESRRSVAWIVVAVAASVLIWSLGAAWAHDFIARSHVTINYTGIFTGTVTSHRVSCERNRKVTVYRVAVGPDPSYGSDRTNNAGHWTVEATADTAGYYYAKASFRRKRRPGHDHVCLEARSDEISIG